MKKIIFSILAFFMALSPLGALAQTGLGANQRVIGHTVTDDYDYEGVMFGQAGTYPVGALLEPSVLSSYKGCKVVGMRVAAAMDLGRVKMFLTDINAGDLYTPTQRLYQGWNNIFFNGDGYTLTGEETLFYGFNYVETEEMVKADVGGLVCMAESSEGGFMLLQGNSLYSLGGVGDLCVQLIVDISSLPAKNMALQVMDSGFKYKKEGEVLDLFFMMMNVGREKIDSYTMAISFDGAEPEKFVIEDEVEPGKTTTWEKLISMPSNWEIGNHTVTGYIAEVDGVPLAEPMKTAKTASFALYKNSMDREAVYVEVYSDQGSYLSAMMDEVNNALKDDLKGMMNLVQVHAPNTTLSTTEAAWLHNVYAYTTPTFTSNRAYFPGENHIAYDLNDFLGMLPADFIVGIMEDVVMQDYYNPTFAGMTLNGQYDPTTRKVELLVDGETLPEAEAFYDKLGVTLMVVEDGVTARQLVVGSSGRATYDNKYKHDNVLRGFITSSMGDEVKTENGKFTAKYSYTLPAEYDPSNVRIVALLTKAGDKVTADNAKDYDVINTASFKLGDFSGISDVIEDGEKEIEGIYSLDGLRLDKSALSAPGLKIIRYTDGTSAKVAR